MSAKAAIAFLAVCILIALAAWWQYKPAAPAPNQTVAIPIADAPILKKVKKVKRPVKVVETYTDEAKADLKLPPAVIANPAEHVIDATRVTASDHPQTVTSTLNTDTGKVETYIKEEPLPWIAFNQRGQARIDTGYKLNRITGVPQRATRITVMHDFMQTKAVNFGVQASIDSDGSAFAGVGIGYRW